MPSIDSIIVWFVILIASLSFHEAAHAWTADRLGDPTARLLGRITLNPLAHIDWVGTVLFPLVALFSGLPLIGWAKPVPVNFHNLRAPRRDFAVVAAAGPISNLVLAVLAAIVLAAAMNAIGSTVVVAVLYRIVVLNVLLAVFNMIPVPPLDGGNVLAGILPEQMAHLFDRMRPFGFLILYALMLTGVLSTVVLPIEQAITGRLLPAY